MYDEKMSTSWKLTLLRVEEGAGLMPGRSAGRGGLALTVGLWKLFLSYASKLLRASPVAQLVKNPPAVRETWVRPLGWENPLKEGMATHSSILAWRIPVDRGAWRATVHGVSKSRIRLSD